MTNKDAMKLIREAEAERQGINITRWYSTIHPKRGGEAKIRTWAVKTWRGKPLIMLAAEYHTDGKPGHVSGRCLVNNTMHTRHFNWLDFGGKSHVAVWSDVDGCRDEWLEAYDHEFGRGYEFFGQFLNGLEGTKYKYSAWEQTQMRITDFLDCYRVSPMSELLAKAGLSRWLTPRHVARLARNKPLARFLAQHGGELVNVPPSIVQRVYKRDGERADVAEMAAMAELTPYGLTRLPIAPKRIWKWMRAHGVSAAELRHHVDNLTELKRDLAYEPSVLPHDWATYSLATEERVREERELAQEREREIVRKARIEARRFIDAMVAAGKIRKAYRIDTPETETELVAEGRAMSNCVGGYWNRLRAGMCNLVFVRKGGKPYIDLEISMKGEIVQMRYAHNKPVKEKSMDGRMCALIASAYSKREAA